ncbi:MAG: hypothetical protein WAK01_02690 [Methylocystis sp.]
MNAKSLLAPAVLFAALLAASPAAALWPFGSSEPTEADARKVFENLIQKKFDPDAKIVDFKVDRFWRLDVEGAGHEGVEYYYTVKVAFPKGAHLECKPDASGKVAEGCSDSTYFSTTLQNKMIKEKQYIEPGKEIEFKDETRFDKTDSGKWKGQDGNLY